MNNLKSIGKDSLKCLEYSSVISVILIILGALVGVITAGLKMISILESIKASLFIVGSMGLFLGALFILKHRTNEEEKTAAWKEKFEIFSYREVIIVGSIIVLLYGCIIDTILFKVI